MSMIAKNRTKSTWTPLCNEETNNKIFEERRTLVGKWFDKWSDEQRKRVLEELLHKCKPKQVQHVRDVALQKLPLIKNDFTQVLPRVMSLYILSFLDPRSLCRCSQVSWYWKFLSELDQLWMPKCLKLAWYLPHQPTPFETGSWKRNYIEHINSLQALRPKHLKPNDFDKLKLDGHREIKITKFKSTKKNVHSTPWKGSDPVPKDTWRYNILENDDIVDSVTKLRKKKVYGSEADQISKNARSKIKTGNNILNQTRRSHSMTHLTAATSFLTPEEKQLWARTLSIPLPEDKPVNSQNGYHHKVSTANQIKSPPKQSNHPITARSERDPPSTPLFPQNPWNMPNGEDSDQ
ncbi:hypothetical protein ScPMuIL_008875 [Solemya velum]